ncbi:MAG: purine-nucleoside phosphorylase [Bacilli bacterium]|nr:purine-nucleoside phosphorylase [Bacilli bacterium]
MATPHIEVNDKNKFAKTVLMPGDPLRAEYIAKTFLTDVEKINNVRNMFGFTGFYKGHKVTVMGSGMGMPSIGIYSFELFDIYGVENIIRIGSCGSYVKEADLYDLILASSAYSESSFAKVAYGYESDTMETDPYLFKVIEEAADKLHYPLVKGTIHSSDVFYRRNGNNDEIEKRHIVGVEMESFALFANAKYLNKRAACLLTVSDSFVTRKETTALERQTSFNKMMEVALEAAVMLDTAK